MDTIFAIYLFFCIYGKAAHLFWSGPGQIEGQMMGRHGGKWFFLIS